MSEFIEYYQGLSEAERKLLALLLEESILDEILKADAGV